MVLLGNALNTTRANNFFIGSAGNFTLSGARNTGISQGTLINLTSGNDNTCGGWGAGNDLTDGSRNSLWGNLVVTDSTSTTDTTASGYLALTIFTGSFGTSIGSLSGSNLGAGVYPCYIGYNAGSAHTLTDSSNICIMHTGVAGESNVCRIGTAGSGDGQIVDMYLAGNVNVTQLNTSGLTGTGQFNFTRNNSGSDYTFIFENSDTSNAASGTALIVVTGGASAGDPFTLYQIAGLTSWVNGIDNSAGDAYKISQAAAFGTNDYFILSAVNGTMTTSSGKVVKTRTVTASSDTAAATDEVLFCNRAGAIALALMSSPETGRVFWVKDISGAASSNFITVTPAAGNIDDLSSYVINTDYGSAGFFYNGSSWSLI